MIVVYSLCCSCLYSNGQILSSIIDGTFPVGDEWQVHLRHPAVSLSQTEFPLLLPNYIIDDEGPVAHLVSVEGKLGHIGSTVQMQTSINAIHVKKKHK